MLNKTYFEISHVTSDYIPETHMHQFRAAPTDFFSTQHPHSHAPNFLASSPIPSTPGTPTAMTTPQPTSDPIVRSLHKAYNRKDLSGFIAAVQRFNEEFTKLREEGEIKRHLEDEDGVVKGERWRGMVSALGESCYQRIVGPGTTTLSE